MKKIFFPFFILFFFLGFSCINSGKGDNSKDEIKTRILQLVEKSFNEMLKKQKSKIEWIGINNVKLKEAKLAIYQINLIIMEDNVQEFVRFLNDTVVYNVLEDDMEVYTKDKLIKERLIYFKRLFFSYKLLHREGLKPPYSNNYHNFLDKILYNRNDNKLYKMIIRVETINKTWIKDRCYEFFCEIYYLDKYKMSSGFGIQKISNKWKITSLNET